MDDWHGVAGGEACPPLPGAGHRPVEAWRSRWPVAAVVAARAGMGATSGVCDAVVVCPMRVVAVVVVLTEVVVVDRGGGC